jgi:hypothetical protein
MKDLLWIAAAMAVALGVVGLAIGPGHDRRTLVSPPKAVAEDFVRRLAAGRYDRAVDHLENRDDVRDERHGSGRIPSPARG